MLLPLQGRNIAYDLVGPDNAPTVCITHSLASDGGSWAEQVPSLLQAGFRVLRCMQHYVHSGLLSFAQKIVFLDHCERRFDAERHEIVFDVVDVLRGIKMRIDLLLDR